MHMQDADPQTQRLYRAAKVISGGRLTDEIADAALALAWALAHHDASNEDATREELRHAEQAVRSARYMLGEQ